MIKQELLQSKTFKILFPMVVVLSIIIIARAGYDFGQYLYRIFH